MPAKFIDDGQPEAGEFDENYVDLRELHAARRPAPQRAWREMKIPRGHAPAIIAPKDVRFFQWLEPPPPKFSNHWKFGFLRRLFC